MSLMMLPGLPLARRQEIRALILRREHELADKRAREAGLTLRCQHADRYADPQDRASEHRRCLGEEPGNSGCLCSCHDQSGVAIEAVREENSA